MNLERCRNEIKYGVCVYVTDDGTRLEVGKNLYPIGNPIPCIRHYKLIACLEEDCVDSISIQDVALDGAREQGLETIATHFSATMRKNKEFKKIKIVAIQLFAKIE